MTQKQMRLTAGIVPIFFAPVPQFLLLRSKSYWDFPKGVLDPGEEALAAAMRELKEETTLEKADFKWGMEFIETEPYSYGKIARYYVAQILKKDVSLPVNPAIGAPEHEEFRWVTFDEGLPLLVPRVRRVLEWAAKKCQS